MSNSYLISKIVNLPASGIPVPVDVTGSFVRCYRATAGQFEMSFDGSQWFEFEKGLRFRLVEGDNFKGLWFRILSGTSTANQVSIYYGTAEVEDNRLNIIDNQEAATLYTRPYPVDPDFNSDFAATLLPDGDSIIVPSHPNRAWFEMDSGAGATDRGVIVEILNAAGTDWNRIATVVRGTSGRRFDFTQSYRVRNDSGVALTVSTVTYYHT